MGGELLQQPDQTLLVNIRGGLDVLGSDGDPIRGIGCEAWERQEIILASSSPSHHSLLNTGWLVGEVTPGKHNYRITNICSAEVEHSKS